MINLDIDMPTGCRFCPIFNGEFGECQLRQCFPSRFNEVRALFDERPNNCPLVEDVPKGEWMKIEAPSYTIIRCTCCGYKDNAIYIPNYCPNCGARMED